MSTLYPNNLFKAFFADLVEHGFLQATSSGIACQKEEHECVMTNTHLNPWQYTSIFQCQHVVCRKVSPGFKDNLLLREYAGRVY